MGGRVVDCARLESVYAARHPGFESPPIRSAGFRFFGTPHELLHPFRSVKLICQIPWPF